MSEDAPLVVGSVVVLKSEDGPRMTVVHVNPPTASGDLVECAWFDRDGNLVRAPLPTAALRGPGEVPQRR